MMLKTLWYLIRIILIIGVTVILASLEGQVDLTWQDYRVQIQLGFAAVIVFLVLLLISWLSGLWFGLGRMPQDWMRARAERRRTRGYQALIRSMSAAAAGDHKIAYYLAYRAQKLLPESEKSLPLLMQAHAARNKGEQVHAETAFRALLTQADTVLLGVQGLVQKSVLEGDFTGALNLAREAFKKQPHTPALLKPIYDLELRNRLWSDALVTLQKLESKKIITKENAIYDQRALWLMLADEAQKQNLLKQELKCLQKSYAVDPDFIPAIIRLVSFYINQNARFRALWILRKAWNKNAHPDLLPLWDRLSPQHENKSKQRERRLKFYQKLVAEAPQNMECLLRLAEVQIEEKIWGEARATLARAEKISSNKKLYLLWVRLEEETERRPENIRQWLDRAANAKDQDPIWVCSKTARTFGSWQGLVEPEGYFNTVYDRSHSHQLENQLGDLKTFDAMASPPKNPPI
jgi:HemY protein